MLDSPHCLATVRLDAGRLPASTPPPHPSEPPPVARREVTYNYFIHPREGMRLTREERMGCNGEGGASIMMGFKKRAFATLVDVSLEELVPQDHFYRHLQKVLDLSFVYDLVRESYSVVGRPSIDPVVFFKLQLVMFFEDIRSERLLLRQVADRLSVRWYVGYDLDEPLPDHSTLSKIRLRYGLEVFRRFFEAIVEQCQQARLVWGKELYFDSTQVNANAYLDYSAPP